MSQEIQSLMAVATALVGMQCDSQLSVLLRNKTAFSYKPKAVKRECVQNNPQLSSKKLERASLGVSHVQVSGRLRTMLPEQTN